MGYSYTIEAHLLLVVHDPNIPKLGPLRKRAVADVDVSAFSLVILWADIERVYVDRRRQRWTFGICAGLHSPIPLLRQQALSHLWPSLYVSHPLSRIPEWFGIYVFSNTDPLLPRTAGGDRFSALEDQRKLYDFLFQTEKRHGWPTAKARAQLEEAWGWQPVGSSSATPADASMGVAMTPPP